MLDYKFSALAVVIGLALAGIFFWSPWAQDRSLDKLRSAGSIRIGYAIEAPYAYLKPGGEIAGSEVIVAQMISKQLGIAHIEWQVYEFNQLIPALRNGQVDAIAAGMFITPERARLVSFSEPTFHVRQGLLVFKGNPKKLHSYADAVVQPNIKIAVLSGSVEQQILHELGMSTERIIEVPDALTGQTAVETQTVDGFALSTISLRWMKLQNQQTNSEVAEPFTFAGKNQYLGYGAIVFRKEDTQLQTAWNAEMKSWIGSQQHLETIASFGMTLTEMPGTTTTQEILSTP